MAIVVVIVMAFIHIRGVGPGRLVSNVLATLKVAALLIFIAVGFSIGAGSGSNVQQVAGPVAATGWLLALIPVMFTYSGWNAAAYMAEEIRDPGRNVPRALALGTAAVIAIYGLLNLLYLYVMPIGELAKVQGSVLDVVAERTLGSAAGDIMGIVSIISLAASVSAMTFAGPRVYYAMARDGVFLPAAARIHPGFRTPAVSIAAQSAWASILILSGSADALTRYTGFAVTLFATVAVAAVFVLRAREPNAPRPFEAIGYPFTPAIFVIVGAAMVINAVYRDPGPSGAGLIVMAAGIPLYLWFRQARR
jgi:APA family basic amino acid/polyamine antiporter